MNQTNSVDLSQLRDIHLPADISWWPVAPGWWLLLLTLVVFTLLLLWLYRHHKKNAWRRAALQELSQIQQQTVTQQKLSALSALLRRVSLTCFSQQHVAALNGTDWIAFLNQHGKANFTPYQDLLLSGPYQQAPQGDINGLIKQCKNWIKQVKPC